MNPFVQFIRPPSPPSKTAASDESIQRLSALIGAKPSTEHTQDLLSPSSALARLSLLVSPPKPAPPPRPERSAEDAKPAQNSYLAKKAAAAFAALSPEEQNRQLLAKAKAAVQAKKPSVGPDAKTVLIARNKVIMRAIAGNNKPKIPIEVPPGITELLIKSVVSENVEELKALLELLEPFEPHLRLACINACIPAPPVAPSVDQSTSSNQLPDLRSCVMHATMQGNIAILRIMLDVGADSDVFCRCGGPDVCNGEPLGTPLLQAIRLGRVDLINLLLERGCSLATAFDPITNESPVLHAVRQRREDMLHIFLAHKADVDQPDNTGEPPLMVALEQLNEPVASALLEAGCKVSMVGKDGNTPLYWAASSGQLELARRFLQNGADPNVVTAVDETALSIAVRNNQAALVRLLLPAGADFRRRLTPRNETMLLHSLIKYCVPPVDAALNLFPDAKAAGEIFEALFERATKDDVNAFDFNRTTPLLCATRVGNATLMNRLIDRGADVNCADRDGETPLLVAARIGSVKLCDLLLDAGALVNCVDSKGNSPLLLAAEFGMIGGQCYELLELLLNDKANIAHTRQRDGSSALHIVVSRGLFDETRLLLRQGADRHQCNSQGKTPLYLASTDAVKRLFLGV